MSSLLDAPSGRAHLRLHRAFTSFEASDAAAAVTSALPTVSSWAWAQGGQQGWSAGPPRTPSANDRRGGQVESSLAFDKRTAHALYAGCRE